ncbi:MAG: outer membrane beta-barrel protein [Bryobacterales bacterium]|nr:outer membrane beta-barrel protein [Bryobacterales bacterium]
MYRFVFFLHLGAAGLAAQSFAGASGGIATLSGDGRTVVDGSRTAVSLYKPENGLAAMVFAGRHFSDWISAQASYSTNRNDLLLTSVIVDGGGERTYEQARRARIHAVVAELMVYFRNKESRIRPYLSAGPGYARIATRAGEVRVLRGAAAVPPAETVAGSVALRVAVGMDVRLAKRLWLRYSFAETIQRNAPSKLLTPAGHRNLANFQNLFGAVWTF